jgi:hypothetical protein
MKRNLTYSKHEESYLTYNGSPEEYLKKASKSLLPMGDLTLVRQFCEFSKFIEALLDRIPEAFSFDLVMRPESELDRIDLLHVLNVTWRWHVMLVSRKQPLTAHYAYAYIMSWSCFCQTFFLTVFENPARSQDVRTLPAQKYAFHQALGRLYNVDISDESIAQYNITDLWDSMKYFLIFGAYTLPYSVDAKEYLHALLYRYASFLTVEEPDLEAVMDNPLFIQEINNNQERGKRYGSAVMGSTTSAAADDGDEAYDAYKSRTIPIQKEQHLTSFFIYEGELLFYHQFYRITISDMLFSFYEENPFIIECMEEEQEKEEEQEEQEEKKNNKNGMGKIIVEKTDYKSAWYEFVMAVCQHPRLEQTIVNDFKKDMMYLYLYHGEKERFVRTWPEANSDPNDILNQTRQSDQMEALRIQAMTPNSILTAYREKGIYEKESVFITLCAIKRWSAYKGYKNHASLKELLIMEEFYSVDELNQKVHRDKKEDSPLFLRLFSVNYAMDGSQIYKTLNFIKALFLWMNLMSKREASFANVIHKSLLRIIPSFNVI